MRLQPFDDLGIELEDVFDDLIERDWLEESDGFRLTALGEQELAKARERMSGAQQDTRSGISTEDYVTTINTLRRMIGNLGGDSDLPGQ